MLSAVRLLIPSLLGGLLAGLGTLAHAQMVPMPANIVTGHAVVRTATTTLTSDLATVSIGLHMNRQGNRGADGLALRDPATNTLWPHWEGRIGVVLDRPADPMSSSFVLAQPAYNGLKMYSLHLLSDYYFAGGFRATAGLVRGASNMPWWPSDQQGATGLNLSMQRLDTLSSPSQDHALDDANRTSPYLGAGYSTRLNGVRTDSAWRFNADLGLISINSNNIDRISRMLQGDEGVENIIRELRLRPVIKFSVNYAF